MLSLLWSLRIEAGSQGRHSEATAALIRHVGEQAPLLPLMYWPSVTVLSRRVRGFEPHPLNIYPVFAELSV